MVEALDADCLKRLRERGRFKRLALGERMVAYRQKPAAERNGLQIDAPAESAIVGIIVVVGYIAAARAAADDFHPTAHVNRHKRGTFGKRALLNGRYRGGNRQRLNVRARAEALANRHYGLAFERRRDDKCT